MDHLPDPIPWPHPVPPLCSLSDLRGIHPYRDRQEDRKRRAAWWRVFWRVAIWIALCAALGSIVAVLVAMGWLEPGLMR